MNKLLDPQQLTQFEFSTIVVSVFIAGLVIGCLIAYALLKRNNRPDAAQAKEIRQDFDEYKEKVDEHFSQTSEMFKDVTTQYKKLYDHMSFGAVDLCNADISSMPRLEMQDAGEKPETDEKPEPDDQTTPVQAHVNTDTNASADAHADADADKDIKADTVTKDDTNATKT